jgi:predicted HTH transcriptional regulator
MRFKIELDKRGYIKKRESFDLEFKQNFQGGDNLLKNMKSLVGMSNNKGGSIIYGIKDRPHIPLGMTNTKYKDTDPATIDRLIREYFSQELIWNSEVFEFNGKEFAEISVKEAENKPIICKKNKDGIVREGAIYYRYRAETREIEFAELKNILDKEKEKEKLLWMQHIQKISMIGPQNVNLFDTYKGEITVGNGKILLDKSIIDKIKFIKEGHFVEKDGEGFPTLKLVGEIEGLIEPEISIPSDSLYPLFTKDLKEQLNLNNHEIKCVLWKLKVKENPKFHTEIKSGKNSNSLHKYSESLIPLIKRMLNREKFLETCLLDYKKSLKKK